MKLYTVTVIDRTTRVKSSTRKLLVQSYATIAGSPREAAENVARENTVLAEDKLIVKESDSRTVGLPSRMVRQQDMIMRVIQDGIEFTGAELPAREV